MDQAVPDRAQPGEEAEASYEVHQAENGGEGRDATENLQGQDLLIPIGQKAGNPEPHHALNGQQAPDETAIDVAEGWQRRARLGDGDFLVGAEDLTQGVADFAQRGVGFDRLVNIRHQVLAAFGRAAQRCQATGDLFTGALSS